MNELKSIMLHKLFMQQQICKPVLYLWKSQYLSDKLQIQKYIALLIFSTYM